MQKKYSREDIKVISGQEAVRKRPSMYLGGDPSEPAIQQSNGSAVSLSCIRRTYKWNLH